VEKGGPKVWDISVFFIKEPNVRKKSPTRRKFAYSGHPVREAQLISYQNRQEALSAEKKTVLVTFSSKSL
jgi:hypothetical protein